MRAAVLRRVLVHAGCRAALALLVSSGVAPSRAAFDSELEVHAGVAPARLDPTPLDGERGPRDASWHVDGATRSASVWLPRAPPRSLIVMLHGAIVQFVAGPRMDPVAIAHRMLRCLAQPAFDALGPLVIVPHGAEGQWWKKEDTAFVLGLVAAARERWPELTSRSVVTGYSNGGIAAWYFARLYPEWFAAAIPMAFDAGIVGATPVPVYAIQGDKDELFEIEPVRVAIERERARGGDVTLAIRHRAGHMTPCDYLPELRAAGQWLEHHAFAARGAARPESP